jgi:hypothetical protein
MSKIKIRFIDIVFFIADLLVYIFLGLLLMGYDDNYDNSKGKYWSLASMNSNEKIIYFAFQIWNIINIGGVVYFVYRLYKRIKTPNK